MRLRLRVIRTEDQRTWEAPYVVLTNPFLPYGNLETAVLETCDDPTEGPEVWEPVEVVR